MSETEAAGTVHGGLAALVGGPLIGLAYLALPAVTTPGTGPLVASALGDMTAMLGTPSLALLSIVPFLAVVIVGIGGWLRVAMPVGRPGIMGGLALLGCAGLAAVAYLFPLVQALGALGLPLGISALRFTDGGFWLTLFGLTVTAAGGLLQLSAFRAARPSPGPQP